VTDENALRHLAIGVRASGRVPCSVIVLTLNEERNIGPCLESLARFEDVHVLDSGSVDATQVLAVHHGVRTAVNPFASFALQRNWGHDNLPLRHSWVLHLDADERMTPELAQEIDSAIASDDGAFAGYMLAERTMLRGRWLRHAAQYPRYQARLVHRERMRFVDHGHGQRESAGLPFGKLLYPYDHLAFSQGLEAWLRKHVGYAFKEAAQVLDGAGNVASPLTTAMSADPVQRRRAVKQLALHLPMRPLLRFLHVLVANRGALDGAAGWEYARMMRLFQSMIDMALREARDMRDRQAHATAVLDTGKRAESFE
jgi:hypothetical protein